MLSRRKMLALTGAASAAPFFSFPEISLAKEKPNYLPILQKTIEENPGVEVIVWSQPIGMEKFCKTIRHCCPNVKIIKLKGMPNLDTEVLKRISVCFGPDSYNYVSLGNMNDLWEHGQIQLDIEGNFCKEIPNE